MAAELADAALATHLAAVLGGGGTTALAQWLLRDFLARRREEAKERREEAKAAKRRAEADLEAETALRYRVETLERDLRRAEGAAEQSRKDVKTLEDDRRTCAAEVRALWRTIEALHPGATGQRVSDARPQEGAA